MNTNKKLQHPLDWFEIPVRDLAKASAFYGAVVGQPLEHKDFGGRDHAIFVAETPCGALIVDPTLTAGASGVRIYLAVTDSVEAAVGRAREAGAKIVQPATSIGPMGTIAAIEDRDGNV